jgi:ABC-2 type transport system permease protein
MSDTVSTLENNNKTAPKTGKEKGKFMDLNIARFGKFPALLQREFLEHKTAFFTTPLVLMCLMTLGLIATALFTGDLAELAGLDASKLADIRAEVNDEINEMSEEGGEMIKLAIMTVIGLPAAPILITLPFVVFFPLLNSLYEERVERSYFFWKSMPTSDVQEIGAKLTMMVVLGPMMLFAFMILSTIIGMAIATPIMMYYEISAFDLMWAPIPFISMWVGAYFHYLVWALWAFPFFAWMMLASSYAPKAPLMFAAVPPVAIIIMERIMWGQTYLGEAILDRIAKKFGLIIIDAFEADRMDGMTIVSLQVGEAFQALGVSMIDPSFWGGVVVGFGFLYGAIYFRKYRA